MCAKARPSAVRSVKTPDAVAALRSWLGSFDALTRERGETYRTERRVKKVWADADHYVKGIVAGTTDYSVTLFYTRGEWSSRCTCPVGVSCKHAYAAGLAWIAHVESGAVEGVDPATIESRPAPELVRKRYPSFCEQWTPVLTAKLGRALTEPETRQLDGLAALFAEVEQAHGALYPGALLRHGFDYTPPPGAPLYKPAYAGWWDHTTAPADPWALWQYIAYDYELAGRPIPEVFRPLTNTAAVRAAIADRLANHELAAWQRALAAADEPASARQHPALADVAGLRARVHPDGGLIIESRTAPDRPWKPPGRAWFSALASTRPIDFEHLTPPEAALGIALAAECRAGFEIPPGRRPLPADVTANLFRTRAARDAIVLPDGRPFVVESTPLVFDARLSSASPDSLELQLSTSDGRNASSATLLTLRPSPLYFFDGRVWQGPPPPPETPLPRAALGDARLMSRLRAVGLRLPAALEENIRRIPLRPVLKCWLTSESREEETMEFHAQLLARAEDFPFEQHWAKTGWQWTQRGAPPPRRSDEPLFEFDLTAAETAAAHLAGFNLNWHPWEGDWVRPVTKNFPEEFIAWRTSLPAGLTVDASPGLASLLDPPLRAHVEFSAAPAPESAGRDWFNLTVRLRVEDTKLTAEEIALLLKARGKWVSLPRHGWRRLEVAGADESTTAALDRLGLDAAEVLADGRPAVHRLHALQLAAEADLLEARDARLATALRERVHAIATVAPPALPAGLRATLRPYQEEGYHFLAHLSALGLGGILADDMGLGKTVQTLAWLLHEAEATHPGASRHPSQEGTQSHAGEDLNPLSRGVPAGRGVSERSEVPSDVRQPVPASRPFRALVVCPKSVIHGWLAETARFAPTLHATAFDPLQRGAQSSLTAPQLLVANYSQLRINAAWFHEQSWDAVILDEGQFIKNPGSQVANVARSLVSRHRFVLTGTPIENRALDLWSLFAFAQPGLLGTQAAFRRQHDQADPAALARLHRRVRHFLLRRTKAQAAPELPPRTEDDLFVELEGEQRRLYDAELKRARAQLLGIDTDRALVSVRFNVLSSLLRLRQICCHPALVDPAHRHLPSAKLDALLERLEELRDEGHQVLVFSQFVEMLHLIRDRLVVAGIGHLLLTGSTENRAELVDTFQNDNTKTVFLLSLKAAGFGLNLTAASYAILYDPWWNPAAEAQAIDRTHRIGQTQPVVAYRLLAEGTVEEKIRALQSDKAALAASVVQEESLAQVLDLESLKRILG